MRGLHSSHLICGFGLAVLCLSPLAMAADAPESAAATEARPEAPSEPVAITGSKKTVMFPHDKGHEKYDCVICHHKVDGKESFAKCADAGCHDDLTAKKGEKSLYYVMHSKSQELKHQTCMSCHVKIVAEKPDLKKALTGCSQSKCHPASKREAAPAKSERQAG